MILTVNNHEYPLEFWGQASANELTMLIHADMLPLIADLTAAKTLTIMNADEVHTFNGFSNIVTVGNLGAALQVMLRRA